MGNKFFITGTGTDIGKTFVTCSLIKQLKESDKNISAIKPVISGWEDGSNINDTVQILSALKLPHTQENIQKISPWRFKAPLAPSMAARIEGGVIDYNALVEFCKNAASRTDYFLCEGAGGVIVPLNENKTTLDLMCDIGLPAILVAGTYLGAISHTLTAIKTLESSGIKIHCIIVNESENSVNLEDTVAELKNFTQHNLSPIRRGAREDTFPIEKMLHL
jgi:dethiobiotin synthetase